MPFLTFDYVISMTYTTISMHIKQSVREYYNLEYNTTISVLILESLREYYKLYLHTTTSMDIQKNACVGIIRSLCAY